MTTTIGWAVGTVPDDPFSALPDGGEDVDLMAAPVDPRDTAARLLAAHRTACCNAKDEDRDYDPRDNEPTDYDR